MIVVMIVVTIMGMVVVMVTVTIMVIVMIMVGFKVNVINLKNQDTFFLITIHVKIRVMVR